MINRETVERNPGKIVIAIDQSLDSTGIAILFPDDIFNDKTMFLLAGVYQGDASSSEVLSALKCDFTVSPGGRKMDFKIGARLGSAVYFHFTVDSEKSAKPEWQQARETSRTVANIVVTIKELAGRSGLDFVCVTEAMAMSGSAGTTAILPVLGTLYSSLHEELYNAGIEAGDINVSSWKKFITGKGNTKKKLANEYVKGLGFDGRIKTDDELDAISLAITAAHSDCVKFRSGRIRPTEFKKKKKKAA